MIENRVRSGLELTLAGDVNGPVHLRGVNQEKINRAAEGRQLTLRTTAVAAVLQGLDSGRVEPALAQEWASFVRRGHPFRATMPLTPLSVEYEQAYEDEIVEIIARLDEIGDLIDGDPPTHEEIAAMLVTLGSHESS